MCVLGSGRERSRLGAGLVRRPGGERDQEIGVAGRQSHLGNSPVQALRPRDASEKQVEM